MVESYSFCIVIILLKYSNVYIVAKAVNTLSAGYI